MQSSDIKGRLLSEHSVTDWMKPRFDQSGGMVKELRIEEISRGAERRQFRTPLEGYHSAKLEGGEYAGEIRGKYVAGSGYKAQLTPEQQAMIGKRVKTVARKMPEVLQTDKYSDKDRETWEYWHLKFFKSQTGTVVNANFIYDVDYLVRIDGDSGPVRSFTAAELEVIE